MKILIDIEMPESCYECPLMPWCDQCEGSSNGTLWIRQERCPLREVDDRVEALEKKLHDVGSSPFDEQLGGK